MCETDGIIQFTKRQNPTPKGEVIDFISSLNIEAGLPYHTATVTLHGFDLPRYTKDIKTALTTEIEGVLDFIRNSPEDNWVETAEEIRLSKQYNRAPLRLPLRVALIIDGVVYEQIHEMVVKVEGDECILINYFINFQPHTALFNRDYIPESENSFL